eukprot:5693339-Pyramimonas_sp.AAC.1
MEGTNQQLAETGRQLLAINHLVENAINGISQRIEDTSQQINEIGQRLERSDSHVQKLEQSMNGFSAERQLDATALSATTKGVESANRKLEKTMLL